MFRITKTLTARLSIWVVSFVAMMFIAAMWMLLWFSHQTLEDEVMERAHATLNSSVLTIDNELHNVETASRNMLWNVEHHLDDPDAMLTYSRMMLENNPIIDGCAIAFKPDYYPDKGRYYMAYYRHEDGCIQRFDTFGDVPYAEQEWYASPVKCDSAMWIDPKSVSKYSPRPIVTFSMPIKGGAGVLAVDISLDKLSHTVLDTRPSPDTYCALLSHSGSLLIHPDSLMLQPGALMKVIKESHNDDEVQLAKALLKGESGTKKLSIRGRENYVFYQPFKKAAWSIVVACPEEEMMGPFYGLRRWAIALTLAGLAVLLTFCIYYIRWQMKPLEKLEASTRYLAEGHFDQPIENTRRKDELGRLQRAFVGMQQSLASFLEKIAQNRRSLDEQGLSLRKAYKHAREAERAQSAFLNSATDKMLQPANAISSMVDIIRQQQDEMKQEMVEKMTREMIANTDTITSLLDDMIAVTTGKKDDITTT